MVKHLVKHRLAALALTIFWLGKAAVAQTPGGITETGAITRWLLLGPYKTGQGCRPSVDPMRRGFLTDGTIRGDQWAPEEGDEAASDCRGAAACLL